MRIQTLASLLTVTLLQTMACSDPIGGLLPVPAAAVPAAAITRNVDELQRLKRSPRACETDATCPAGSHCSSTSHQCSWECLADSDCADGLACSNLGTCLEAAPADLTFTAYSTADSSACLAVPAGERRAVLLGLNDEQRVCADHDECPCGSYCADDATCRVDCLVGGQPVPELECDDGKSCTPLGRCAASPADPGPQIEVTLELAPTVLVANTATGPVLVEAQITMEATTLDVVAAQHPATVRVAFAERNDPAPGPMPRVKCAAGEALASSCELAGGWTFDILSGSLRSSPRKVWVELPQIASADDWTLEARSQWADIAATSVVRAAPVVIPPTDAGRYTGTITWPQAGGNDLTLDVEAIVTPTHVALFEATRVMLPDGHVVLSRSPALSTTLAWLRSDVASGPSTRFDVRLDLGALAYNTSDGILTGVISLITRSGSEPLALEIERTGGIDAPVCTAGSTCAAGRYCNAAMLRCLPASGPAEGGIVADAAALPSGALRSAQVEAWMGPLQTVVTSHAAHLAGRDVTGIERAYCYRSPSQIGPQSFGLTTTEPSLDLRCSDNAAQPTFGYANRTKEVEVNAQGAETFNLLDACVADLSVQPTGPASPANLLGTKACVSLGRFFASIGANVVNGVAQAPQGGAQKVLSQILRQWLSVNAFVARTTVQEQEYDDVLGSGGAPVHERFGSAVDLMERGWRVLLDARVRTQFTSGADWQDVAGAPDYRFVSRPVARWSFNTVSSIEQDVENDHDLMITGGALASSIGNFVINNNSNSTCQSSRPVALSDRGFSLVGYVAAGVDGTFTLFEKNTPGGHRFWIDLTWAKTGNSSQIFVAFKDSDGGVAKFTVPLALGFYAFVVEGSTYRLYRFTRFSPTIEEFTPTQVIGGGPRWGTPGKVSLACDVPNQAILVDEISLWSRPLAKETVFALAKPYHNAESVGQPLQTSLPPRNLSVSSADEQAAGLALHILEAANANLDLIDAYLESERGILYEECYLGAASPARERGLTRAGRGLRMVSLMEGEAAVLAAAPGAAMAPWYERYQANQIELAGKRARVLEAVRRAGSCTNPLGVSEDDLPLFHGVAVGSSERFFASSRFLTQQARQEIDAADAELLQARNAYQQQRVSAFQVTMSVIDKLERLRKLRLDYEGILRRYCGAPAGGQKLLDGFMSGSLNAGNCFFKTENPSCQNLSDTPIAAVPSSCLRGELGERILAIQAAQIDSQNAMSSYDRAIDQYDSEMDYCARRQVFHEQSDQILVKHQLHMQKLRAEKRSAGMFGSFVKGMVGMAVGMASGNPAIAIGAWLDTAGMIVGQPEAELAEDENQAAAGYEAVAQARSHVLDLMACYQSADNQKFAIDASRDVIKRTYHDVKAAMLGLDTAANELAALVDEATGQLAVEEAIDRTPPHHHFWLDDHIDAYRRHLRYARRLTYLALRSFEYESQQTIGLRGQVLTARRPDSLEAVVEAIEQRNAPMQGEQGFVIGETAIVLSLRDEILRLENLATNTHRAPGDAPITAEEAFRRYLKSDSSKIYRDGDYLGRGIRFSLRPAGWSETSCAERIWRVTTSVQMQGAVNNARMVLLQENAFASQQCRAASRGELHVARIRPFHNLLVGDVSATFETPSRYTAMNVDGLLNKTRVEMEVLPEGKHEGFAGRGLYGNYILLFPPDQFPLTVVGNLKDVLIRFDIVEVTNVTL